jgi:hypothetical protein
MSPSERFERAGAGFKWKGKGIRTIANRMRDFQKLAQFLSVVGQNEMMMQEFQMKYSMPKTLGKFMMSLDIDPEEVMLGKTEIAAAEMRRNIQEQAGAEAEAEGEGGAEAGPGAPAAMPEEGGVEEGMENAGGPAERTM